MNSLTLRYLGTVKSALRFILESTYGHHLV
jgi:hypothetical protein